MAADRGVMAPDREICNLYSCNEVLLGRALDPPENQRTRACQAEFVLPLT